MAEGYAKFSGSVEDDTQNKHVQYRGNFENNTFNHFDKESPALYRFEEKYQYIGLFENGNADGAGT